MKTAGLFFLLMLCMSTNMLGQVAPNKTDKQGQRAGKWIVWIDEDGAQTDNKTLASRYYLINYKHGQPKGFVKEYDMSGLLMWEGEMKTVMPDTVHGLARAFYKDGKTNWEYHFLNGVMNGDASQFYESGALKWQCNYTGDYADGLYKEYYENGQIMREGPVALGKKTGTFVFYKEDGSKIKEVTYVNDTITGQYKEYSENGMLKYAGWKENGNWNGVLTTYDAEGEVNDYYMLQADSVISVLEVITNVSTNLLPMADQEFGLSQSLLLEEYFRKKYGEESPLYPFAVSSVAQYYFSMGNKKEAGPWILKSYNLEKLAIGSEEESSADKWHLLGLMLEGTGENQMAWEAYSYAIKKSYENGNPTSETIEYLSRSAAMSVSMGHLTEGLASYQTLLTYCDQMPEEAGLTCASAVLDYSSHLSSAFRDEQALKVLETWESRLENSSLATDWILRKANVWMNLNRTDEAMMAYQSLYKMFEENRDTLLHLDVTSKLAGYYMNAANYAASEPLWLEAVELASRMTVTDSLDYYRRLDDLSGYYVWVGRYDEAIALKSRSLSFRIKDMAARQNSMEGILAQGAAESIVVFETLNLGRLYDQTGQLGPAGLLFQSAIDIATSSEGDSSFLYATALEAWAGHQMEAGNLEAARKAYLDAIAMSDERFSTINVNAFTWKDNLSELYIRMRQPEAALELAEQVLQARIEEYEEGHPILTASYARLANIYEDLGKTDTALALNARVLHSQLKNLGISFSVMTAEEQEDFLSTFRYQFDNFNDKATRYGTGENDAFTQMLDYQLINRALLLFSSQVARRNFTENTDSHIRDLYKEWIQECQYLTKLQASSSDIPVAVIDSLQSLTSSMEKELSLSTGKDVARLPNITSEQIKAHLQDNEVYVSFIRYPQYSESDPPVWHLGALVVRTDQQVQWTPIGEEKSMFELIRRKEKETEKDFIDRLYLFPEDGFESNLYEGDKLFTLTWKTLIPYFPENARVYFTPDGILNQLNLSAIPTGDGSYMCFDYDMVLINNPTKLSENWKPLSANSEMSISLLGGISYDASEEEIIAGLSTDHRPLQDIPLSAQSEVAHRGGVWDYLPGTLAEVSTVAESLQNSNWRTEVFSGPSASEERLKMETGTEAADILHIATHGFFSAERNRNPMFQTGILLAGGNKSWQGFKPSNGLDDGILTAAEVSYLDLRQTKLVVLSACETGLGQFISNEGVFGLQRALTLAGVSHLMMSMWKVSDRETALFMQQFYLNLSKGESLHAAYQSAQKTMSRRYSPYYWAAFVLQE